MNKKNTQLATPELLTNTTKDNTMATIDTQTEITTEASTEEKDMTQEKTSINDADAIKAYENVLRAELSELSKNNTEGELKTIIASKKRLIEDESEGFTYENFLSWLMHFCAYMYMYKFSPSDANDLLEDNYPYYCSVDEAIELEIKGSSILNLSKKDFEVIDSSQINYKTGDVATFSVVMNNVRKAQFSVISPK